MNMKKLFLLLALMGMVAIGCSKEQPNDNEGGNKDDIPESIFFGLDKESITLSPDGGSVDVIVYSNYKWEISGASDWCAPSITTGEANEDGQKVTFSADLTYDDREAIFWFRCADEKIKFVVSQKLKAVIIPDANNSFTIPAEGGVAVLSYKTSVNCDVIIPEDAQDWITIAPATRGLVSENVTLEIAENTTYDPRSAVIKVVAKDNAELVVEYTINQEQKPTYSLYYTSSDGKIVEPYPYFDATILSNTYQEGVGEIKFSAPITTIGDRAFFNRSSLTSVTIPDSVTSIGDEAFHLCRSLQKFEGMFVSEDGRCLIVDGVLNSFAPAGITKYTIPDSVTSIGVSAFSYYNNLTSVTIPDSVTTIGDEAFYHCSSLTSVTIPDSVTSIGNSAFSGCSSLTSVTIPDSVTSIGNSAFSGCSSLTSVTIPDSVTSIGDYAFSSCSSLKSVTIPESVTTIGDYAFYACNNLTSVTIPDSLITIGDCAFSNCDNLTSITIPDSVTSIGDQAFSSCINLTSVTISESVTSIGDRAFYRCARITSVTIPESVTTIGYDAFAYCLSLTSVYCKPTTPPEGSSIMFGNPNYIGDMKIYVPTESVELYKNASNWIYYASVIVGYNF